MLIQILGTGCPNCKKLEEHTIKAANELNLEYKLEKVSDLNKIMDFGIIMTPGLVINGIVKSTGKVPDIEDIKEMLH